MNENLENKFICKYCGRIFKRQCDLTRHINIKHLKITKASGHGFKIKKQCPNCGRYISIVNFNRHYNSCIKHKKCKCKEVDEIFSKCTKEEDKYICPICNKLYNKYGIKNHIWRKHTKEGMYFDSLENRKKRNFKSWNKGLTKEIDKRVARCANTFIKNHNLGLHKKPIISDKQSWKNHISISMKKAHSEGRAGTFPRRNKKSYPEKWFIKMLKNEFNLIENIDYKTEYYFYKQFLDFAWPERKLCIEIDGCQHKRFEDIKIKDKRKEENLKKENWKLLRLDWKYIYNNTQQSIEKVKNFLK